MILIPFDPTVSADQILNVTLGDYSAKLRLLWNVRSGYWEMTLSGTFGEVVGLKVVPSWPLLRNRKATCSFVGDFLVMPMVKTALGTEIGYFDLGVKWGLCWITADEYSSWEDHYGLG